MIVTTMQAVGEMGRGSSERRVNGRSIFAAELGVAPARQHFEMDTAQRGVMCLRTAQGHASYRIGEHRVS
jgi:hypothetical protein